MRLIGIRKLPIKDKDIKNEGFISKTVPSLFLIILIDIKIKVNYLSVQYSLSSLMAKGISSISFTKRQKGT